MECGQLDVKRVFHVLFTAFYFQRTIAFDVCLVPYK